MPLFSLIEAIGIIQIVLLIRDLFLCGKCSHGAPESQD